MRQLCAVSLLGTTSFSLTLAALPAYAVSVGVGVGAAGLVITVMLAATVLTQSAVPALTSRFGIGPVFAAGLVALGAPTPLYLLDSRLWWLLAVSAVRGAGFAVLTVLGTTMSARLVPVARRGEAVGMYGLSTALPGLLAVPAGVALTLNGQFGWVAAVAVVPVLVAPTAWLLGRHDSAQPQAEPGVRTRAALGAAATPSVILLMVTLAGAGVLTILPVGRPDGTLAAVALLALGLTATLARWLVGSRVDRHGTRLLLPAAVACAIGGLLLLALGLTLDGTAAYGVVVLAAGIFGLGYGGVQNITLVIAFARAGPGQTTAASALWNASFDVGSGIGALVVGVLAATSLGLSGGYLVCAVGVALTLPLVLLVTARTSSPTTR